MDWIAQITDLHCGHVRTTGQGPVDTTAGTRRAIAHLNALRPRPLAVLITGDLVAAEKPEDYAALAVLLKDLDLPYYVIPGNHDDRAMIRDALGDAAYFPPEGEPLRYCVEDLPLRVVALDSHEAGEVGGRLGPDQLAWLDARLAEETERPTLVVVHHPPILIGIEIFDGIGLRDRDDLAAVLRRHPQVKAVACGHVHRPIAAFWAERLVVVTPSTGYQYCLALEEGGDIFPVVEPPACRLFAWHPEQGLVTHLSYIPTDD